MLLSSSVYAAGVASGAASWLIVRGVRLHASRLGLVDQPNDRSSHRSPTPRGGGIGIVIGVAVGLFTASILAGPLSARAWLLFGAGVLVAAVGLVDDFRRVPPAIRLLVQIAAAVAVVAATGPIRNLPLPEPLDVTIGSEAVCWLISILWIAAVTNFFNFMDGIDGLAGGQAAASFGGVLIAAWSADAFALAICAGAASLGFLFHNWSPARVFMGDVGSGFLGFVIASLPFLAPVELRGHAVLAVAVGITLFLLDPLETLVRRAWAGKSLIQAHREHTYQQFLAPGDAAGPTARLLVVSGFVLAMFGAAAFRLPAAGWFALTMAICVYQAERSIAGRRLGARAKHV